MWSGCLARERKREEGKRKEKENVKKKGVGEKGRKKRGKKEGGEKKSRMKRRKEGRRVMVSHNYRKSQNLHVYAWLFFAMSPPDYSHSASWAGEGGGGDASGRECSAYKIRASMFNSSAVVLSGLFQFPHYPHDTTVPLSFPLDYWPLHSSFSLACGKTPSLPLQRDFLSCFPCVFCSRTSRHWRECVFWIQRHQKLSC